MIPVDQTLFGVPGGNCFAACVASILELDICEVPYFMQDNRWKPRFKEWIAYEQGKHIEFYPLDGKWFPPQIYIMHGTSPRGNHCVIADGSRIIFDPHPSRAGLVTIREATVIY